MGVIRGEKEWLAGYGLVDDMEHIIEPVSSSDNESVTNETVNQHRRRAARQRIPRRDTSISEHINKRRSGQKQARRCENLRELVNMVEREDLEMDFNMFEPSMSAFAELFTEREKMHVWNEFISTSEEEQLAFLDRQNGNSNHDKYPDDLDNSNSDLDESWEQVEVIDKRASHPSFSAEESFLKIDKNIRAMLKRRHKPMGMLVSLEEEIVNFFKEWPRSVFISKLSSSYERMMIHALCQYLELVSKSFDSEGQRQTQVENPRPAFFLPPVLLTQYLEQAANNNNIQHSSLYNSRGTTDN